MAGHHHLHLIHPPRLGLLRPRATCSRCPLQALARPRAACALRRRSGGAAAAASASARRSPARAAVGGGLGCCRCLLAEGGSKRTRQRGELVGPPAGSGPLGQAAKEGPPGRRLRGGQQAAAAAVGPPRSGRRGGGVAWPWPCACACARDGAGFSHRARCRWGRGERQELLLRVGGRPGGRLGARGADAGHALAPAFVLQRTRGQGPAHQQLGMVAAVAQRHLRHGSGTWGKSSGGAKRTKVVRQRLWVNWDKPSTRQLLR